MPAEAWDRTPTDQDATALHRRTFWRHDTVSQHYAEYERYGEQREPIEQPQHILCSQWFKEQLDEFLDGDRWRFERYIGRLDSLIRQRRQRAVEQLVRSQADTPGVRRQRAADIDVQKRPKRRGIVANRRD